MFDAYFDNEEEFEELMNMINYETEEDTVGKFETEIISENKIIELQKLKVQKEEEIARLKVQKDEEIARLKAKIKDLESQIGLK